MALEPESWTRDQTRQNFDESSGFKCYPTSLGQPGAVTAFSRQSRRTVAATLIKYAANLNSFPTLLTASLYFR